MNKYFKEFADKQGWKTDDNMAYGMYGGYPVSVTLGTMFYIVFGCSPNDKAAELKEFIHKKNLNAVVGNFTADKQAFSFTLSALTMKSAMSKLEDVLNKVSAKLREFGVKENICPFCMEPLEENVVGVRIGTAYFKAHDKCADVLVKECAEESEKKKSAAGNYLYGSLGAVLGALAGCTAWVVVYALGFISGWVAVLIGFLSGLLYDKFGGKNNTPKIVIVVAASMICMLLTFFGCMVVTVKIAMTTQGIGGDAVIMFFDLMKTNEEFSRAVTSDFVMSIIFGVLGCGYTVYSYIRSKKAEKKGVAVER